MRVTFIAVGAEQLSISLLSAVLRREGHDVSLAFHPALFGYDGFMDVRALSRAFDRTDEIVDEIVAGSPDLIAFSVLTASYRWSVAVAEAVRSRCGASVIFGGVHPSAVPEVCLENNAVDYVCVGEGEEAIVELCADLPAQGARPAAPIGNLWWKDDGGDLVRGPSRPFLGDLDRLPHFEKDLWEPHIRIADTWMTMASRGCPYRCTFCFNNFFADLPGEHRGGYLRRRSVEHMMGELVDAKARWGIRRVDFEDDIFTVSRSWLKDFLREYRREIDLPFQCLVHPRYIDHDTARWLADAGCQHVQMGVQSVDEEYKRRQLLRMERDSHLRRALDALRSADLDLKLDHMLGLPGEPIEAQELARELYAQYPPRRIQTFWLVHLPGVSLTTDAVASGELSEEAYERLVRGEVRHYHSADTEARSDTYRRYELLFRMLPFLPGPIRRRLRVHHLPSMPPIPTHLVGLALEAANALRHRDAETINYLRFYGRHVRLHGVSAVWRMLRRRRSTTLADWEHRSLVHQAPSASTRSTARSTCATSGGADGGAVEVVLRRERGRSV